MNLRRDNHYLPECYQRGFADSAGHVWIKKENQPPEYRNPRSVGMRRNFYIRQVRGKEDDHIETFFDHHVETPFAQISQRVKVEGAEFRNLTGTEAGVLTRFIASQAVRTLAHRNCVNVQAGRPVEKNVFHNTMLRLMQQFATVWNKYPPKFDFFTTLPMVGKYFISGDHPIVLIHVRNNPIWTPHDEGTPEITPVDRVLNNPGFAFWLTLTPYVCVSVRPQDGTKPTLPPSPMLPIYVKQLNDMIRGQCKLFTLARDRESLDA